MTTDEYTTEGEVRSSSSVRLYIDERDEWTNSTTVRPDEPETNPRRIDEYRRGRVEHGSPGRYRSLAPTSASGGGEGRPSGPSTAGAAKPVARRSTAALDAELEVVNTPPTSFNGTLTPVMQERTRALTCTFAPGKHAVAAKLAATPGHLLDLSHPNLDSIGQPFSTLIHGSTTLLRFCCASCCACPRLHARPFDARASVVRAWRVCGEKTQNGPAQTPLGAKTNRRFSILSASKDEPATSFQPFWLRGELMVGEGLLQAPVTWPAPRWGTGRGVARLLRDRLDRPLPFSFHQPPRRPSGSFAFTRQGTPAGS